jgi:hypothetical protein
MEMQDDTGWILALPYLWWMGMILVLTIGYFIFSKTERGYRLHAGIIASILVIGSLVGGELLYVTHAIHFGDRQIQRFAPWYRNFRQWFAHMMPRPEEGVLPLRVTKIEGNVITGTSPDGQKWQVNVTCGDTACQEKMSKIQPLSRPIFFLWKISADHVFQASDFRFPPRTSAERWKFREELSHKNTSGEVRRM